MSPTFRLLVVASVWLLLAAVAAAYPPLAAAWLWLGVGTAVVVLVDAALVRFASPLVVQRRLPGRFALGEPGEVRLIIRNDSPRLARIQIYDGIPPGAKAPVLPWTGEVPANREIRVFHPVTLSERGEALFTRVHLRRVSLLGLWLRRTLHLEDEKVKVYPNYEPVIRFALLAMQHRENPMGIVRRPRAGSSRDFHQLRDYRDGDPLAQ
ncbi:MAG: hypothetical protein EON87_19310, partial [Brevundimonas sp.]